MAAAAETQITFRLPLALARRVDRVARQSGLLRSQILRTAAEAYVQVAEDDGAPPPIERVKDLIGSLRSGVPDLAERHREHLAEALRVGR